jgi:hypothetical protein
MNELGDCEGFIYAAYVAGPPDKQIWAVLDVHATHGFGPLLYDKALRHVTNKYGSLISNQEAINRGYTSPAGGTSNQAQNVWGKYRHDRPDVGEDDLGFYFKRKMK